MDGGSRPGYRPGEFDQERVAVYTLLCPSVLSVEAMKIL
jgi:hypothetical protein